MEARMVMKSGHTCGTDQQGVWTSGVIYSEQKYCLIQGKACTKKYGGEEYDGDSRTLELHVQRLRKKMGWENQLVAVYKVGYRLEIA